MTELPDGVELPDDFVTYAWVGQRMRNGIWMVELCSVISRIPNHKIYETESEERARQVAALVREHLAVTKKMLG